MAYLVSCVGVVSEIVKGRVQGYWGRLLLSCFYVGIVRGASVSYIAVSVIKQVVFNVVYVKFVNNMCNKCAHLQFVSIRDLPLTDILQQKYSQWSWSVRMCRRKDMCRKGRFPATVRVERDDRPSRAWPSMTARVLLPLTAT